MIISFPKNSIYCNTIVVVIAWHFLQCFYVHTYIHVYIIYQKIYALYCHFHILLLSLQSFIPQHLSVSLFPFLLFTRSYILTLEPLQSTKFIRVLRDEKQIVESNRLLFFLIYNIHENANTTVHVDIKLICMWVDDNVIAFFIVLLTNIKDGVPKKREFWHSNLNWAFLLEMANMKRFWKVNIHTQTHLYYSTLCQNLHFKTSTQIPSAKTQFKFMHSTEVW